MSQQRTSAPYQALRAALLADSRAWKRTTLLNRFGRRAFERAVHERTLVCLLPGVYVASELARERRTMIEAVSLWVSPHAAVGGAAAAHALGMTKRHFAKVTVSASHEFRRVAPPPWVRLRRSTVIVAQRWVHRTRVVAPADAVIQGWEDFSRSQRTGFVLDAIRDAHVSSDELKERTAAYPRIKGRRGLERLLELASGGITSYLEHRARTKVLTGQEFHGLEWQAPLQCNGRQYVADALHRRAGVVIEFDGAAHHAGDAARRSDIERDAHMASAGFQTLRFTYQDIVDRPAWCQQIAAQAIRARCGKNCAQ